MKFTDRYLQYWRIAKVRPYLQPGSRVLDIGSADGVLFKRLPHISRESLGIDPTLKGSTTVAGVALVAGYFPQDMPQAKSFDAITLLAVLEHFPASVYSQVAEGCARFLKPGGRLLITVPSPSVDRILSVLTLFRLVDGMSLEEHHGYEIRNTKKIFHPPEFFLERHQHFQLGLNNLFVFRRNEESRLGHNGIVTNRDSHES